MRFINTKILLATAAIVSFNAQATPITITAMKASTATKTYSLFTFDAVKLSKNGLSVPQALANLTAQLAASTNPVITPCQITGDVNVTNISCGNNAMRLGGNEIFTKTEAGNLPGLTLTLDTGVQIQYSGNFLSPVGLIPGDSTGRVVHVHFNQRMAQFGFVIDSGGPAINGVQFIVNRQTTPLIALPPLTAQFVGVQDSTGFTDVTIVPSGNPRVWLADQYSYLPLSAF